MLIQSQRPGLRPQTTAHLAKTMSLLELTTDELRQKVDTELSNNPALEVVDERFCPSCRRPIPGTGPCPVCSRPALDQEQPIVFTSPREDYLGLPVSHAYEDSSQEDWVPAVEDLPTYVLRQIVAELNPADHYLAAHLLTNLDEDGLLRSSLLEIARYNHVPVSRLEAILHLVQRADPVGVGCPNPQAALLVQLEVLEETRPVPANARRAIQEGYELLLRRNFNELGRRLGITARQAQSLGQFIGDNLNPYPGRSHWGDAGSSGHNPTAFHNPDIIVSLLNSDPTSPLVVEILSPYAGMLRVSSQIKEALTDPEMEDDKKEKLQDDIDRAQLLVKCLQQRDHTLVRLLQRLVVIQRNFILFGNAHIQPITRASLAFELNVHESTVSRAVSDKALQLPNGRIIQLATLFDRSLHIRTALRRIVDSEEEPLSDTQIAELLKQQGFPIARRTVAKYRDIEHIESARMRQSRSFMSS